MSYIGIAAQAGTISSNIEKLIKSGEGSPSLASRLGTTSNSITEFISGRATIGIASLLGTTISNTQELRDSIGREGAIGLIIGLACGIGYNENKK